MATISYLNSADLGSVASDVTLSASYAIGGVVDNCLFVAVTAGTSDFVTDVSFAGVSLSLIAKGQVSGGNWIYLFVGTRLPSISQPLTITASSPGFLAMVASSYGNVLFSAPDNSTSGTDAGSTVTTSLTPIRDQCWTILAIASTGGGVGPQAASGCTLRQASGTILGLFDSGGLITPPASYNMSVLMPAAGTFAVMASFAPTSGGGTAAGTNPVSASLVTRSRGYTFPRFIN